MPPPVSEAKFVLVVLIPIAEMHVRSTDNNFPGLAILQLLIVRTNNAHLAIGRRPSGGACCALRKRRENSHVGLSLTIPPTSSAPRAAVRGHHLPPSRRGERAAERLKVVPIGTILTSNCLRRWSQ